MELENMQLAVIRNVLKAEDEDFVLLVAQESEATGLTPREMALKGYTRVKMYGVNGIGLARPNSTIANWIASRV